MGYRIILLDIARKYIRSNVLKQYIDLASECNYNQIQLYFSDNQGFRLALNDMNIKVSGAEYDLSSALGDGYVDEAMDMCPDGTGKYLTQEEILDLIRYAREKKIEIVPSFNTPGHMGTILQVFPEFRYRDSKGLSSNSLDITNETARQFALAVLEKYISFFAQCGCRYFNLVADEYANDMAGFSGLYNDGNYPKFMSYLIEAIQIVRKHNMIPRVFNDALYMDDTHENEIGKDVEVCYCFTYDTTAKSIAEKGHPIINGTIDLFWVLGKKDWQVTPANARSIDIRKFVDGSTISNPTGAMLCIWCDKANAENDEEMLQNSTPAIRAFSESAHFIQ